jgi:inward rectifier potassium channel
MSLLPKIKRKNDAPEFGFGNVTNNSGFRILNTDGSANIIRKGEPKFNLINIYHSLVSMNWWRFNLLIIVFYSVLNLFFASLYYIFTPEGIRGMEYTNEFERFMEIFYFSAQSLTTVGYGRLYPSGHLCSALASIEALIGLMGFALATGLLYGRFSRPTAKLLYSKNIIVSPYSHPRFLEKADRALMFRITNERSNQLIEVEAQILFSYNEDLNGKLVRRFQILNLETSKISFLAMTWTIVHPIDENSPLRNLTYEELSKIDTEFMVSIKAIDDTYVQQVYNRSSYKWNDVVFDAKFESTLFTDASGKTGIDLTKLSNYIQINQ